MKYIKTGFKVSSINYTARITSQYCTLLISNQTVQHQHTSLTTSMSINLTQQMTAYVCFPKASNSQRYTAATGWLTRFNQRTRGATTLNVTRPPPHNIAVTHKQLHTKYCFAPRNELVEYTFNSQFDSHISRISLISSPISITQCTVLFI